MTFIRPWWYYIVLIRYKTLYPFFPIFQVIFRHQGLIPPRAWLRKWLDDSDTGTSPHHCGGQIPETLGIFCPIKVSPHALAPLCLNLTSRSHLRNRVTWWSQYDSIELTRTDSNTTSRFCNSPQAFAGFSAGMSENEALKLYWRAPPLTNISPTQPLHSKPITVVSNAIRLGISPNRSSWD